MVRCTTVLHQEINVSGDKLTISLAKGHGIFLLVCLFLLLQYWFALLLNKIPYSAKDNDISRGEETNESLSFIFPTILILSYALNNWSNESQGQEDMKYIVKAW